MGIRSGKNLKVLFPKPYGLKIFENWTSFLYLKKKRKKMFYENSRKRFKVILENLFLFIYFFHPVLVQEKFAFLHFRLLL